MELLTRPDWFIKLKILYTFIIGEDCKGGIKQKISYEFSFGSWAEGTGGICCIRDVFM